MQDAMHCHSLHQPGPISSSLAFPKARLKGVRKATTGAAKQVCVHHLSVSTQPSFRFFAVIASSESATASSAIVLTASLRQLRIQPTKFGRKYLPADSLMEK